MDRYGNHLVNGFVDRLGRFHPLAIHARIKKLKTERNWHLDRGILVALLLGVILSWPFWARPGLPRETDAELHVFRIAELGYSLSDGNLYPRWAPDFYYGHGYPIFNYYAPLTYHLGNWLTFLQPGRAVTGAKLLFILAVILGALGAYLLGREYGGQGGGLLGSVGFASSPYILLINPHIRGDLAEVFALAAVPWTLWFWDLLWQGRGRRVFLGAVITAAITLLSHNLTGLTTMALLMGFSLWQWLEIGTRLQVRRQPPSPLSLWRAKMWRAIFWRALLAGLLVVMLTAYFWLPFLAERQFIRLNVTGEGHYNFRQHFVRLKTLLTPLRPLDWGATAPQFPMSAGPLGIGLALLGVGGRFLQRFLTSVRNDTASTRSDTTSVRNDKGSARSNKPKATDGAEATLLGSLIFYLSAAGFLFFLITPASAFLWQHLPGLHYYQFPWRFLGHLAALLIPCMASLGSVLENDKKWAYIQEFGVLLILGLALFTALPGLYPPPWDTVFGDVSPQAMIDFELEGRARGTTSTDDFIPTTVDVIPEPQTSLLQSYVSQTDLPPSNLRVDRVNRHTLPEGAQVEILPARAPNNHLHVQSPKKFLLRLYLFYFPGWRAYVDGEEVPIDVAEPEGFITLWVPQGEHNVSIRFEDTFARSIGWGIAGIGLCVLLWVYRTLPKSQSSAASSLRHYPVVMRYGIVFLIGFALFKAGIADPRGWFHYTSPPGKAQPARYKQSAQFGDAINLLGYDLSSQTVKAGQTLDVTLYWRAQRPLTTPYRSFVHLAYPEGKVWTQSDHLNPGGFPTTRWPPLEQYVWDKHRLTLPETLPEGEYLLSVGLYTLTKGRLAVIESTSGGRLDNVILEQRVTVK